MKTSEDSLSLSVIKKQRHSGTISNSESFLRNSLHLQGLRKLKLYCENVMPSAEDFSPFSKIYRLFLALVHRFLAYDTNENKKFG